MAFLLVLFQVMIFSYKIRHNTLEKQALHTFPRINKQNTRKLDPHVHRRACTCKTQENIAH